MPNHGGKLGRKVMVGLGVIVAAIIVLMLTNPDSSGDTKYMAWLEKEHGIFCTHDPIQLVICVQATDSEEELDWRSRAVKNAGLYTIYKDHYRNLDGESVNIHAVGILNMFFNK